MLFLLTFYYTCHIGQTKLRNMTTVSLQHLSNIGSIEAGYVTLYGEYGKRYSNRVLNIPGYDWVPCSRKLQSNFTTSPNELMLVISDSDDDYIPVTSEIWVTRSNIVRSF